MRHSLILMILGLTVLFTSCKTKNVTAQESNEGKKYAQVDTDFDEKIERSAEEWKELLTDKEYHVLREAGTERPFTGDLLKNKEEGKYVCGGCGLVLFGSSTKFKSGTGWPSFYEPVNEKNVGEIVDNSHGMARTEVVCNRCQGHLGHVFNDGPKPTGLRYCINAVSLDFVKGEEFEE